MQFTEKKTRSLKSQERSRTNHIGKHGKLVLSRHLLTQDVFLYIIIEGEGFPYFFKRNDLTLSWNDLTFILERSDRNDQQNRGRPICLVITNVRFKDKTRTSISVELSRLTEPKCLYEEKLARLGG